MDIEIDITKVVLETDRLILRSWEDTDLQDFFEYASVDGVGERAGWKHHESIDVSSKILQSFIADKNVFALQYKANHKVIGSLGLHNAWTNSDPNYENLRAKEIGYVLSKDYWGMGLMPEAVSAVIQFCFDQYNLDAIAIAHFSTNLQSQRVIEKCGFQFVKYSKYYAKQLEKEFDDMQYILFRG